MSVNTLGYITQFTPDHVSGFAYSIEDNNPVVVRCEINGEIIAEQKADRKVPFLSKRELSDQHGFKFDLRSFGAFHQRDSIHVYANDMILPFTPNLTFLLLKEQYFTIPKEDLFFFMHIPKTAGTSFRMMLNKQFEQKEIWPNREHLSANNRRYPNHQVLREMKPEEMAPLGLMMGHYPLWTLRFMKQRPRVITFLRLPEEHMLSLAFHKQTKDPNITDKSVFDIIENHVQDNPQCYYFLPAHISPNDIDEENFDIVLRNLSMCDFVGIKEQFEASVSRLEKKYGWSLGARLKKNLAASDKTISEDVKRLIEKKTKYDRKLYNYALEKFKSYE